MPSGERLEVGDRALLRRFEHGTAAADVKAANEQARALAAALRDASFDEIEDVVPGATSVLVVLRAGADPSPPLRAALEEPPRDVAQPGARLHEISVEYDGPDLDEVARMHGIAREELVRRHAEAEYTVGFIGFSPGFPYLFGLPDDLATPRLATPRTRVPAGSVAIGGSFAGIYPSASPGGWRLIGRTEVRLFDPNRDPPALLAPGDRVRFVAR
jgi:KipI family sensor histidine kinase inhibitor